MVWAFSRILSLAKGGYGGRGGGRRVDEAQRSDVRERGELVESTSPGVASSRRAAVLLWKLLSSPTSILRQNSATQTTPSCRSQNPPAPPIEAATRQFRPLPGSLSDKSQPSRLVALAGLLLRDGPHLGPPFCFGCTYDSWSDPHTYTTHPHPSSHSQSHT